MFTSLNYSIFLATFVGKDKNLRIFAKGVKKNIYYEQNETTTSSLRNLVVFFFLCG